MRKRVVSLVMAVLVISSSVNLTAFAEEITEETEAYSEINENDTTVLELETEETDIFTPVDADTFCEEDSSESYIEETVTKDYLEADTAETNNTVVIEDWAKHDESIRANYATSYMTTLDEINAKYPPTRDQGQEGTCTAFATTALVEFYMINHGLADKTIDLSEAQCWSFRDYESPYGFATEDDVPYYLFSTGAERQERNSSYLSYKYEFCNNKYYVEWDSHRNSVYTSIEGIKQHILDNGAVDYGYYEDHQFDYSSNLYYYYNSHGGNHSVVIIGWDDNIPAENFVSSTGEVAPGDGGWLIRNSWTSTPSMSHLSYFYVSYFTGGPVENSVKSVTEIPSYDYVVHTDNYTSIGVCDPVTDEYTPTPQHYTSDTVQTFLLTDKPQCEIINPDNGEVLKSGYYTIHPGETVDTNYSRYLLGISKDYTIKFDANGGTGTMDDFILSTSDKVQYLPDNTFTKENCAFMGWSATKNGEVEFSENGSLASVESNLTLYAVWKTYSDLLVKGENGTVTSLNIPSTMSKFIVPENITSLGDGINPVTSREDLIVIIPNSETVINPKALSSAVIIYGEALSNAQTYAKTNNNTFFTHIRAHFIKTDSYKDLGYKNLSDENSSVVINTVDKSYAINKTNNTYYQLNTHSKTLKNMSEYVTDGIIKIYDWTEKIEVTSTPYLYVYDSDASGASVKRILNQSDVIDEGQLIFIGGTYLVNNWGDELESTYSAQCEDESKIIWSSYYPNELTIKSPCTVSINSWFKDPYSVIREYEDTTAVTYSFLDDYVLKPSSRVSYTLRFKTGYESTDDYIIPSTPSTDDDFADDDKGEVLSEDLPFDDTRSSLERISAIPTGLWTSDISDITYNGLVQKPAIRVYYSKKLLTLNKDYTLIYKNNKNAGTAQIIITGKGNYTGKIIKTFNIVPVDINTFTLASNEIVLKYNKKVQKAANTISGYLNGKYITLNNKSNLTYTYLDTMDGAYKEAGTYTVTVSGKGNYCGSLSFKETIKETATTSLSRVAFSKDLSKAYSYTGSDILPVNETSLTLKDKTSLKGIERCSYAQKITDNLSVEEYDYIYEYIGNTILPGTVTVRFVGINSYSGIVSKKYKINGISFKGYSIKGLEKSYVYTNTAPIEPTITVESKTTTLIKDTDYTLTYLNSFKTGTATVVVKGINSYTGTIKATYKITKPSIADLYESGLINITYTDTSTFTKSGSKVNNLVVTLNSLPLTEGKDFSVTYINNKKTGTAAFYLNGKGNLSGNLKNTEVLNFTITPLDISKTSITTSDISLSAYKKAPKKIGNLTIKDGSLALKNKTDYEIITDTLTESISEEIKTISYVIKGKGNYTGAVRVKYHIYSNDISKVKVKTPLKVYSYNGVSIDKSELILTNPSTKTDLTLDDFEIISVTNNRNAGNAKVLIHGKGAYGGYKTITVKINKKSIL